MIDYCIMLRCVLLHGYVKKNYSVLQGLRFVGNATEMHADGTKRRKPN
jgi:hypothetical protein